MIEFSIGIIDTSVNTNAFNFISFVKTYFCEKGTIVEKYGNKNMDINHGTKCAKIIDYYIKDRIKLTLHCICIWEDVKDCKVENNLLLALRWFTENKIKVISMSIGTVDVYACNKVSQAIKQFYTEGGIIFAANHNELKFSIPASLPQVISVSSAYRLKTSRFNFLYNNGFANRIVHCDTYIVNEPPIYLVDSNSYATPKEIASFLNSLCGEGQDLRKYKILDNLRTAVSLDEKFFLPDFALVNIYLGNDSKIQGIDNLSKINGKFEIYCPKSVLLVLDDVKNWNECESLLANSSEQICGVAILNINESTRQYMKHLSNRGIIVWELEKYYGILKKVLKKYSVQRYLETVPIVIIQYMQTDNLISVMKEMETLLVREHYNLRVCSDYLYGLFYGIPYIPRQFFHSKICEFLVDFYTQDLLIYYRVAGDYSDIEVRGDLYLNIDDGPFNNYSAIAEMFCS